MLTQEHTMKTIDTLLVTPNTTLHDVLTCINLDARGIALVVDDERHLLGVVTDGDMRRAILGRVDLASAVGTLIRNKKSEPITARVSTPHYELVTLVHRTGVSHVPLLDENSRVVGLVTLVDLLEEDELALQAVVMAGGRGTRLHPLTMEMPNPCSGR